MIDGDTIRVRLDGARFTVRLTGVDTPETTHPTRGVEPYGPEAAAYTTARLTGADGRLLRYVVLASGENVNATLSAKGTPGPFVRSRSPGVRNFYSWKPRPGAPGGGYGPTCLPQETPPHDE